MKEETFYLVSPLILQFLYTYGRNEIYPYYEKAIYYGFPFIFNVSYHIKIIWGDTSNEATDKEVAPTD